MSDRIAVFNAGQVVQVGTPAEVYEHPATAFVAGFVGTSNLLRGEVAKTVLGEDGTFSIRPEKIALNGEPGEGVVTAAGRVAEVVYAGAATRFVVDLDAGARLVALQQNLQTTSMDVQSYRDAPVTLHWRREHVVSIPTTESL
jgi:putative spermidine/putrescine transport system ATP-binding protein